jgi:hypothetical protein
MRGQEGEHLPERSNLPRQIVKSRAILGDCASLYVGIGGKLEDMFDSLNGKFRAGLHINCFTPDARPACCEGDNILAGGDAILSGEHLIFGWRKAD